jgi:hypothetical protein
MGGTAFLLILFAVSGAISSLSCASSFVFGDVRSYQGS